jgi:dinuclear metal center YbgI/SA1388 family protein
MTISLAELRQYLDAYLRIAEVPDEPGALNGLQVDNRGTIGAIVAAVDASQATIDRVANEISRGTIPGPALLLVHHGLFWDGNQPVTGRRYRRIRALLEHDIAVYAAHIPLDIHPEVGNNAVLAHELGLSSITTFDLYKGVPLGAVGDLAVERDELVRRLEGRLGATVRLIPGGPARTRRVGIITGGAGGRIGAAAAAGCDTFITGEGAHYTYFDAMEGGINVLFAGHYATETVGVQTLARHLSEHFNLPWAFHDHPTGL